MLNFHNNVRNAPMENESEKNNNQIVLFNIVTHNKGQSPYCRAHTSTHIR
jgi:hypothetical protein